MKKNIFKHLFAFILCVATLFGASKVYALGDTAYFKESTVFSNRDQITLSYNCGSTDCELGSTYKKAELDGKTIYAFCFNHALNAPPTSSPANELKKRDLTACEKSRVYNFAYVLENGLGGNWSLGGDFTEHEKYYITQLAIWFVQGECGGVTLSSVQNLHCKACNTTGRKADILKAATTLYNNAMQQKAPTKGSLSIIPNNSKMTVTNDKKFYRTTDFTISGSGFSTYTVKFANAPGGKLVDSSTNKEYDSGATLNAGAKFYIKVPVDKVPNGKSLNVDITVTAGTVHKNIAVFEPVNKQIAYQNLGVEYGTTLPLNAKATASVDSLGTLVIKKREIKEDGQIIEDMKDVTIKVTRASDNVVVATWNTTEKNPMTLSNIATGVYYVEEIKAPEGVIKAEKVNVTVKPVEITTVILDNYRSIKVPISKQDATTGAELPGAHIVLKDAFGNQVEEWTSGTTPHIIQYDFTKHPEMKEYCLEETIAPKGYQQKTNTQCFTLNDKFGVDKPVVMENIPETEIKISKQDATTGKELPGAKLIIKKKDTGEKVDEWISTTKPHYVKLDPGKYILVEITAPKGYGLSEEFVEFEVTKDGVKQTVVMKNSPIPDTADIPVVYIAVGLCLAILVAGFSMFKLSKQEQA